MGDAKAAGADVSDVVDLTGLASHAWLDALDHLHPGANVNRRPGGLEEYRGAGEGTP